jgi:DNA-binding PadR family transcriptional regulator
MEENMGSSYAAPGPFDVFRVMAEAAQKIAGVTEHRSHEHAGPHDHDHGHGHGHGHGPGLRGRHGGFGPPWGGGWGGFGGGGWSGFPGGAPFGPPHRGRGGWKAKRGDVRAAILALLAEQPRNGYQVIQEIGERSGGAWTPSPGAVYPALQQLADEGLIAGEESEGRKTFHLTDAGRTYVEEHADQVRAPWEAMQAEADGDVGNLFKLAAQTGAAIVQVAQAGTEGQIAEARQILSDTRRRLYQLLAEDTEDE